MKRMEQRFEAYGETVCRFVSHATDKEQKAIRAELSAHMEDHAQALLDAGYDEDYAFRIAVEAMGDPEEVGKALNREYPLLWLLLSRGFWVVILLLSVLLAFWAYDVYDQYRQNTQLPTLEAMQEQMGPIPLYPLDLTHPVGDHATLLIYGVGLWQQEDGSYTAYLCALSRPNHFWETASDFSYRLTFSSGQRIIPDALEGRQVRGTVTNTIACMHDLQYGDPLTAHYDSYGVVFDLEIPLPWKEVTP